MTAISDPAATVIRRPRLLVLGQVVQRPRALAYVLTGVLAAGVAQTWFSAGTVLGHGDEPPPIPPGSQVLSLWNDFTRGEGISSYDIVGLPYWGWLRLIAAMGGSLGLGQRLWLTALFAASVVAVVYFAFALTAKPLVAAIAGFFTIFNATQLVNPAAHLEFATVTEAALLGGLLVRAGADSDGRRRPLKFALASLGLSFVFFNPPHVALILVWLVFCVFLAVLCHGRPAVRRIARFALAALPLVVLVNLWWLVPAALTLAGPGGADRRPTIDVHAWAWTLRRASIPNALALNTTWGWGYAQYYPYAASVGRFPFGPLRFCLPFLGLLGLILARGRERRVAIMLAVAGLAAVIVAKGLHPPFSGFNDWLYANVPGYWLFRDPGFALFILLIAYCVLAGLAVSHLLRMRIGRLPAGGILAAVLVAGATAAVHPLFTGKLLANDRPLGTGGPQVKVPSAWTQLGSYLNAQPPEGKVLVLPAVPFYQEPTTWGYWGVPFTRLVVHRGVLESRTAETSYLRSVGDVSSLVGNVEDDILSGNSSAIALELKTIGVRYVVIRRDFDRTLSVGTLTSADSLITAVTRVPHLVHVRSFEHALELYRVTGVNGGEVYPAVPVTYHGPSRWISAALSVDPTAALLIRQSARGADSGFLRVYRSQRGLWRVTARTFGTGLEVRLTDPTASLERRQGHLPQLPTRQLTLARIAPPFFLTVGDRGFPVRRLLPRWTNLGFVRLSDQTVVRAWRLDTAKASVPVSRLTKLMDCAGVVGDRRTPRQIGLGARLIKAGGSTFLRLRASQHSACVTALVPWVTPGVPVRISLQYRTVRGTGASMCAWEFGPDRCGRLPRLKRSGRWRPFADTFVPEEGTSVTRLFFYADATRAPAADDYAKVGFQRYRQVGAGTLHVPALIEVGRVRAGSARAKQLARPTPQDPALDMSAVSPLIDCAAGNPQAPEEASLAEATRSTPIGPTFRLRARKHSACIYFPLQPFQPDVPYRLTFGYRTLGGRDARVCFWRDGPQTCATLPGLKRSRDWQRVDAIVSPAAGTTAARLFLYADGAEGQETVTEYRELSAVPLVAAAVLGAPTRRALPHITYRRVSPSEFHARVSNARGPFLLVVTEGFARGWTVTASGQTGRGRHVIVNGYANGWLLPWRGSYDLEIRFAPARYARAAQLVDLGFVPLAFGFLLLGGLGIRVRRPGWRRRTCSEPAGRCSGDRSSSGASPE
jgi:arabinofuranan 3-O-arabinosyltransferase